MICSTHIERFGQATLELCVSAIEQKGKTAKRQTGMGELSHMQKFIQHSHSHHHISFALFHILLQLLSGFQWKPFTGACFYDSTAPLILSHLFICFVSIFNVHIFLHWNIAQHDSLNHLYSLFGRQYRRLCSLLTYVSFPVSFISNVLKEYCSTSQ